MADSPVSFRVSIAKTTVIPQGKIGIVSSADGAPLDPGRLLAKAIGSHRNFQDAEQFIASGGQKGPQVEILTPGTYRILTDSIPIDGDNERKPGLFTMRLCDATVISENMIGVVEALDGAPLDPRDYVATPIEGHDNFQDADEFIRSGGQRGPELDNTFNPFEVISEDGFTMQLEVRVVFRVKPEDAPFMVAKIGSIEKLIQNVMHPLIDSIFRNQASESSAMAYLQNRHEEQERAEARVRAHLLKYHVDVVNVLICHIRLPEELMKTQTEKILAEQRQNMFDAQREAEEKRIQLEKTRAHADNQRDLMAATVGVEIAGKRAEQRKAEGEGEAHYILATGKAESEKVRLMGEAQGVAYAEQVNAIGPQGVALVETLKVIGEKGVRITPDILASGAGDAGGGIGTLLLLNLFRDRLSLAKGGDNGSIASQKVEA
jgi:uncharacterized membrane protein YqiK